jgi:hypothetical protein
MRVKNRIEALIKRVCRMKSWKVLETDSTYTFSCELSKPSGSLAALIRNADVVVSIELASGLRCF